MEDGVPGTGEKYRGQQLWTRGYFAVATSNVTAKMIAEYIEHYFEGKEGKTSCEWVILRLKSNP
jgi:REP element-mobilizing transposase RayT